jgi:hypothetical protein
MFIANKVAGIGGLDTVNALNAASVKHDGLGDVINIFDAMYIAQYVVRLRDINYNLMDVGFAPHTPLGDTEGRFAAKVPEPISAVAGDGTAPASAFLSVTPDFKVTSTGLADTDRAWGTGAAIDPVKPAAPGPALATPALLDLRLLAGQQIAGGAATALAALRELAGPLSPEDDARLEAKYAPFFIKPSAEATAYFDKLNPLLYETLALRAAAATAAAEFDAAWSEAVAAALYDHEEGVRAALAIADSSRRKLEAVQVRLAEVAAETARLGNPPDPIAAAAAARRRHDAAVKTVMSLLPAPEPPEAPAGGVWALVQLDRIDNPAPRFPGVTMSSMITYTSYDFWAFYYDSDRSDEISERMNHFARWAALPAVLEVGYDVRIGVERAGFHDGGTVEHPIMLYDWRYAVVSDTLVSDRPELRGRTWQVTEPHPHIPMGTWHYLQYQRGGAGLDNEVKGWGGTELVPSGREEGQQMILAILIEHRVLTGDWKGPLPGMYRVYHYRWTSDPQVIAEAERIAAAAAGWQGREQAAASAQGRPQAATDLHWDYIINIRRNLNQDYLELARETDPARRAAIEFRIVRGESYLHAELERFAAGGEPDATAFHRDNIAIILRQLEQDRAELARETDPVRRAALEFRIARGELDLIAEAEQIAAAAAGGQGGEPDAATAPGEEQADAIARRERIEFHRRSIAIIRRHLERDRAELAREADPARRAEFEFLIMHRESDLIAEQDLIRSIETGQIVRSRTPFDDYARDRFVQSIRANQLKMEQFQRSNAALQRLAAMLPPDEAEHARRFIDRQVTRESMANFDIEQVRKVANALHLKVTGHVQRDRALAAEADAWATYKLETAESMKSAADAGMFVCSLFGGKPVKMLYQATTGYVEGGPREAVLRAAAWFSTPAYVATEALRGYERLDEQGQPRGWSGAATDAATALVMARLFEYGAGKAKRWSAGATPGGPTVAQKSQLAEFQRGRAAGEQRVRDFARAQAELERAAHSGATPQQLLGLQARVRSAAAVVNADPHAKNYLKFRGDFHAQRAYNAHMRSVHADTEARFHELMRQRGWNQQPLREFRNAASAGSVGMDYDIGLDEAAATALRRHGRPASLNKWQRDAQAAWEQAYRQSTGQSARGSWETVTTSAHAEAYKDLAWLSDDISAIQRKWAQQAPDVTRYKNWHILNDPAVGPMLRLQEASRGTAKDMQTKLLPLLAAARPASPQAAQALQESKRHWTKVQSILAAFGRNEIDPIQASRRIREVTGGKDIPQVVDEAAQMIESLGRYTGR